MRLPIVPHIGNKDVLRELGTTIPIARRETIRVERGGRRTVSI
jgi:hypothetical protein